MLIASSAVLKLSLLRTLGMPSALLLLMCSNRIFALGLMHHGDARARESSIDTSEHYGTKKVESLLSPYDLVDIAGERGHSWQDLEPLENRAIMSGTNRAMYCKSSGSVLNY